MKHFTLKKPDGTDVVLTQDQLVIGYNNGEVDPNWLARLHNSERWHPVGELIGISGTPAPPLLPSSSLQVTHANGLFAVHSLDQRSFALPTVLIGLGCAALIGLLQTLLDASMFPVDQRPYAIALLACSGLIGTCLGMVLYARTSRTPPVARLSGLHCDPTGLCHVHGEAVLNSSLKRDAGRVSEFRVVSLRCSGALWTNPVEWIDVNAAFAEGTATAFAVSSITFSSPSGEYLVGLSPFAAIRAGTLRLFPSGQSATVLGAVQSLLGARSELPDSHQPKLRLRLFCHDPYVHRMSPGSKNTIAAIVGGVLGGAAGGAVVGTVHGMAQSMSAKAHLSAMHDYKARRFINDDATTSAITEMEKNQSLSVEFVL